MEWNENKIHNNKNLRKITKKEENNAVKSNPLSKTYVTLWSIHLQNRTDNMVYIRRPIKFV